MDEDRSTGGGAGVPGGGLLWGAAALAALLLILWFGVIPEFRSLIRCVPGPDPMSKGNLGAIRSALSIYYGDMEGVYPADLRSLTVDGKYLSSIPEVAARPRHAATSEIEHYPARVPGDTGKWGYANDPAHEDFGKLWVDCTHTDTKGLLWTSY